MHAVDQVGTVPAALTTYLAVQEFKPDLIIRCSAVTMCHPVSAPSECPDALGRAPSRCATICRMPGSTVMRRHAVPVERIRHPIATTPYHSRRCRNTNALHGKPFRALTVSGLRAAFRQEAELSAMCTSANLS